GRNDEARMTNDETGRGGQDAFPSPFRHSSFELRRFYRGSHHGAAVTVTWLGLTPVLFVSSDSLTVSPESTVLMK
ncbi:MAG: hypothetical protein JWO31_3478, partial [Phycisphaerales bacterium]|nr:hypothetical protein [Phycisphaerales bacterium]